jgi:hypothetical protein
MADDGEDVYPQPVLTYRLDDLVAFCRLPLPNHIKLDVDGGELALLRGASHTLRTPQLRSILIEVSTALSVEVTAELERAGLVLQSKVQRRNKAGEDHVWYGIFVRAAAATIDDDAGAAGATLGQ